MSSEKPTSGLEARLITAAKTSVVLIVLVGIVMAMSGERENLDKLFHFPELFWAFGLFFIIGFAFG